MRDKEILYYVAHCDSFLTSTKFFCSQSIRFFRSTLEFISHVFAML